MELILWLYGDFLWMWMGKLMKKKGSRICPHTLGRYPKLPQTPTRNSFTNYWWNVPGIFQGYVGGILEKWPKVFTKYKNVASSDRGFETLPTQTMHYCKGSPSNIRTFALFDAPKMGNWMTPEWIREIYKNISQILGTHYLSVMCLSLFRRSKELLEKTAVQHQIVTKWDSWRCYWKIVSS